MGYKLIAQLTLIVAALVLIFVYIQPALGEMKSRQDELFQLNETIAKATDFNVRLRELISIRDSFSSSDIRALEKFVPTEIDQLKTMSEIAGIFSSRNITVHSLLAHEVVDPFGDISFESGVVTDSGVYTDLSYQDFEVAFTGTYLDLRDVLMLTEASDSLLEVVELNFDTASDAVEDATQNVARGEHAYNIVFRTYGLPIDTNI